MGTKRNQVIQSDEAWVDGTPIHYADQVSHVHMNSATAKLVLSTEVAQGKIVPTGIVVIPSHQAFAFAITLIRASRDSNLAPVIRENALLAQQIDALKQILAEGPTESDAAPKNRGSAH